jgi:hypothetical protein
MILNNIFNFLTSPKTALIILLIFFLGFFLAGGLTGSFDNNFLAVGPTKDENGKPAKFMGLSLDTWNKVGVVYAIIFISAVLEKYYTNIMNQKIISHVTNNTITKVPYSKLWSYLILLVDPFINTLLLIIRLYATATFQIQYIIPQFVAAYLTNLPFIIKLLASKTYIN